MESGPARRTVPKTARPAPVARPSVTAASGSPWPLHRRMTTVGDTVRSGPAPSKSRDSTSTSPSRHSSSFASNTSNGATAMRLGSSTGLACDRVSSAPPATAPTVARPRPSGSQRQRETSGLGEGDSSTANASSPRTTGAGTESAPARGGGLGESSTPRWRRRTIASKAPSGSRFKSLRSRVS